MSLTKWHVLSEALKISLGLPAILLQKCLHIRIYNTAPIRTLLHTNYCESQIKSNGILTRLEMVTVVEEYSLIIKNVRDGDMAQVIGKCKVLSSNPSTDLPQMQIKDLQIVKICSHSRWKKVIASFMQKCEHQIVFLDLE
jgi:hypothetical protein